jgi:bifunctional non-homologous end joining protein LigD
MSRFRYVIHEHHATRLHYDLRLEVGGVLKSWAVPKGPSMNPADKRLAVQVEDHPMEYGTFEGVIPQGRYGAGAVVIWDQGIFTPLEDAATGLEKGHLSFRLDGGRLHGEFSLVRMKGRKSGKDWLLIKKNDDKSDLSWRLESALTSEKHRSLKVINPPCDSHS